LLNPHRTAEGKKFVLTKQIGRGAIAKIKPREKFGYTVGWGTKD